MNNTEDGFIQWTLYQNVCDKLKESSDLEELSEVFSHLKSDEDRVQFVLNLGVIDQIIQINPCYTAKSSGKSNELRVVGNKFFQQKLFHKALEKYNESILLAPESDTDTAALAYANRSAVLFHLENYEACLKDIQASLYFNYPKDKIYKVLDRRARCLKLLGREKEAILAVHEAKKSLENSKLKSSDKISWVKELEKKLNIENDNAKLPKTTLETIRSGFPDVPELTHGVNVKYIAASKAFGIMTSPYKGRYPVASQDVDIGDVLVLEKPFASVLLPEHQDTHCHHCLKRIISPLPCRQCANVKYCSSECVNNSWQQYHCFECKHLQLIHRAGKYGHLALRTLLKAGLVHCKETASKSKCKDASGDLKLLGFNDKDVYDSKDYSPIYNLVGHTESRSVGDLFRRTVIAVYLLKCIEQTDFFSDSMVKDEFSGNLSKCFAFAGGVILRHLQSFPCNAHEISELQLSLKSVETSVTMETGAGIYATLSLFNHSCDPNVTRFFYGDMCTVRALRSIATGQEIADNYGVLSALSPICERQSMLKSQYFFQCKCQACIENAPLFSEIATVKHPTLCCGHCKASLPEHTNERQLIACENCHKEQDIDFKLKLLDKSEKRFSEAVEKLFQGDVKHSLPHIKSHLLILEKNVHPPWHGYNSCKELIKQCYNILGNCNIVE